MRFFTSLTFAVLALATSAQIIDVESMTKVDLPAGVTADRAVLSPTGDFVVAASIQDAG